MSNDWELINPKENGITFMILTIQQMKEIIEQLHAQERSDPRDSVLLVGRRIIPGCEPAVIAVAFCPEDLTEGTCLTFK